LTPRLRTALVDAKPALLDLLREPARRLAATVATRLREVVLEYDDLEGGGELDLRITALIEEAVGLELLLGDLDRRDLMRVVLDDSPALAADCTLRLELHAA